MTLVELLGFALYGYLMAGVVLLLVILASTNLYAMAQLGRAYRPVSPPTTAVIVGIAIWPMVVKAFVQQFVGQSPPGS